MELIPPNYKFGGVGVRSLVCPIPVHISREKKEYNRMNPIPDSANNERIDCSKKKVLMNLAGGVLFVILGGALIYDRMAAKDLLSGLSAFGAILLVGGGLMCPIYFIWLFSTRYFFLTPTAMQWFNSDNDRQPLNVPYDNIERVQMMDKPNDGIGIRLRDPQRPDTRWGNLSFEERRQEFGYDIVLVDEFTSPLQKVLEGIRSRIETNRA